MCNSHYASNLHFNLNNYFCDSKWVMKDFSGSLIERKPEIKTAREIYFPFFFYLTELENYVKTFFHFSRLCVASTLGVIWGLDGLKPWTPWVHLGVDPPFDWGVGTRCLLISLLSSIMLWLCKMKLIKYPIYPYQSWKGAEMLLLNITCSSSLKNRECCTFDTTVFSF